MAILAPYGQFSDPTQELGDSIERQGDTLTEHMEETGDTIDPNFVYFDKGKSAYHAVHRKRGDMGRLLKDVEEHNLPLDRQPAFENLDRFSREDPKCSIMYFLQIINSGYTVLVLTPEKKRIGPQSPQSDIDWAISELKRANAESERKAAIARRNVKKRHRRHLEKGTLISTRVPNWLKVVDGKVVEIPERVAIVRLIFDLCIKGDGLWRIVKELTARGVEPWGRSKIWRKDDVHNIITGRTVLGEYQPFEDGKPAGPAYKGYYPVVIDEDTHSWANRVMKGRKLKCGRPGKKVANLFTGLLMDARTQSRMLIFSQSSGSKGKQIKNRLIGPVGSMDGSIPGVFLAYDTVFEPALLELLGKINPADVLNEKPVSKAGTIKAERLAVEADLRNLAAELLKVRGKSATLAPLVTAPGSAVRRLARTGSRRSPSREQPRQRGLAGHEKPDPPGERPEAPEAVEGGAGPYHQGHLGLDCAASHAPMDRCANPFR